MTKTYKDLILASIAQQIDGQNSKGMETYGRPLEECPPGDYDWNLMINEELIDALQYQQKELQRLRELAGSVLTLRAFQELSERTLPEVHSTVEAREAISNYSMGLAGETGEIVDILKKYLYHGHKLDRDAAKGELGDVLHYLSGLCTLLGFDLEDVANYNIEKLKRRYPNGFSQAASIHRAD